MLFIGVFITVLILGFMDYMSLNRYPILVLNGKRYKMRFFFILCCALLVTIAWYRNPLFGADSHNFYRNYLRVRSGYGRIYEAGYDLLAQTSSWLDFEYTGFVRLVSFLTLIPLFVAYGKRKERGWLLLAFLAFNFFETFSTLRNYLAITMLLVSFESAMEGKKKRAIILAMVSFLFHRSSIIFIFLYLISKHIKTNVICWISLIGILIFIYCFRLYQPVYSLVTRISDYYSGYIYKGLHRSTSYTISMALVLCLILISKPEACHTEYNRVLINFFGYMFLFITLCPWFPNYDRVSRCSFVFTSLLVTNLLVNLKAKNRVIATCVFVMWLLLSMYFNQGLNVDFDRNFFVDSGGIY